MLSRHEVLAMIALVEADPHAVATIRDPLGDNAGVGRLVPDSWAGGLRNAGLLLRGKSPRRDMDTWWKVCEGIAVNTRDLIEYGRRRNPALRRVQRVFVVTRNAGAWIKPEHHATALAMDDGHTHVIDWHASLNVRNPMLYRSVRDFREDRAQPFEGFRGWD